MPLDASIICSHPANKTSPDGYDNFRDFAWRTSQQSQRLLQFGDGTPICLEPDSKYSLLSLKLSQFLTTEQFGALFYAIGQALDAMVQQEIIPENLVQGVATILDIETQSVPEGLTDKEVDVRLQGSITLQYSERE